MARAAHLSGLLGLQEAVDLVRARRTTGDRRQVIVVDASTPVVAPVEERAPGALTREHTAAADLHALHLSDVEVLCHIELLC